MKTSEQAFEEYQKLCRIEERATNTNRGRNLIGNFNVKKQDYYIVILKKIEMNLISKKEKIVVRGNLPFMDYHFQYEERGVEEFFELLEKFVEKPFFEYFIIHNRKEKNKLSYYDKPEFRKETIKDIRVTIGNEARKDINEEEIKKRINELLQRQRKATEQEERDFNKYFVLMEKIEDLKRLFPRVGYYGYERNKGQTIFIDKREYNNKLEIIENELKKVCENPFLEMPNIEYKEINELQSFDEWRDENVEAEEVWVDLDDEEKENYDGDFKKFLKVNYESYVENFEE